MPAIQYNDAAFRVQFPAFKSTQQYSMETMQLYWMVATSYINNCQQWWGQKGPQQLTLALNLMTAHVAICFGKAASGRSTGLTIQASIDKINTTIMPPPVQDEWQYWLNTTPYGQSLLALLRSKAVGGFFVNGGLPFRIY